jgi:hypothetical protein
MRPFIRAMTTAERRRDVRVRVTVPAVLLRRGGEKVEIVDASYRGMFVVLSEAPGINELLRFRVSLPVGDVIVHAVTVRLIRWQGRVGVGLRLFAMDAQALNEWQQFVRWTLRPQIAA